MSYAETTDGAVLVEYVDKPKGEWTYMLTSYGKVFRKRDGGDWDMYYDVMLHAVPAHVALIRKAPFQKILVDNYEGALPAQPTVRYEPPRAKTTLRTKSGKELTDKDIEKLAAEAEAGYDPEKIEETPRSVERRTKVAETKEKAEPKKKAESKAAAAPNANKPQKLGARAKRLLETGLDLSADKQVKVLEKADALSRARIIPKTGKPDTLTRVWDIYRAAGVEMPTSIADEEADFLKTGVLKRSSGANGGSAAPKEERGGKSAASPAPSNGTSKKQQSTPEKKPANDGPQDAGSGKVPETSTAPASPTTEPSAQETETL